MVLDGEEIDFVGSSDTCSEGLMECNQGGNKFCCDQLPITDVKIINDTDRNELLFQDQNYEFLDFSEGFKLAFLKS